MKKVLSVLVAVLLVAVALVPAFASDEVKMVPSATEAKVGDTITIKYDIAEGYTGITTTLKYDPNYFEYVDGSAEATDLMLTELNDTVEGEIKAASASTDPTEAGTLFQAQFKVKKVNGEFTAELEKLIDENDNDVSAGVAIAPVTIAAKADESTTKSDETTTKKDETTTKSSGGNGGSGSNSGSNSVPSPKTGGAQVIGSAAAVLVASAFVAYTMKKKIED